MMILFSKCPDKPLQKFEMKSYQEVVISQLKQMRDDNHLLKWYMNKSGRLTNDLEVLKGSFNAVSEKMRKVSEENQIVRQKTKLHHKEIKEEVISDPVWQTSIQIWDFYCQCIVYIWDLYFAALIKPLVFTPCPVFSICPEIENYIHLSGKTFQIYSNIEFILIASNGLIFLNITSLCFLFNLLNTMCSGWYISWRRTLPFFIKYCNFYLVSNIKYLHIFFALL